MLAANNMTLSEPNVLYLDEKPPIIVKRKKSTPAKTKTKSTKKKEIIKTKKISKAPQKTYTVNEKDSLTPNKEEMEQSNDPLCTPQMEIKIEKLEIKLDEDVNVDDFKQNYDSDGQDDDDLDDEDEDANDFEDDDMFESELQKMETSAESNEDEPLIKLRKGRPKKYKKREKYENLIKAPRSIKCRFTCKQNCTEKFTEVQRKRMCDYYWSLTDEEKLNYLRKHVKSHRLTRFKSAKANPRGNNCWFYLKDCIKEDDEDDGYVNDDATHGISDLIRVCRKYFIATLCVESTFIKKSLSGYAEEAEKGLELLVETFKANKEKEKEQAKQIKQVLDPETGNLIIIDPKNKKIASKEKKPKEKRQQSKSNDSVEEHFPKPIKCAIRCIHKCHTKFTEEERKQMCDTFWSMDFKHRKDYVLANVEIKEIETQMTPEFRMPNRPPRSYHTRYFLRTCLQGEKQRVCKHFFNNTLRTYRTFISNAIEFADKTTGYYTGSDRRGKHVAANKIAGNRSQPILDHISSYPTWVPNKKSKTKYLHHSLTIKKMYEEYREMCVQRNLKPVSKHYYDKSLHENFRLLFLINPNGKKGGGFLKLNPNLSHYTGEEPGGFWLDPKGERLDTRFFNLGQSMFFNEETFQYQQPQSTIISNSSQDSLSNVDNPCTSLQLNPLNYTTSAAQQLANFVNPATSSLNARAIGPQSLARLELNPSLYDNLPHSSSSMFRMN